MASDNSNCCAGSQHWQVSCPDKWRHSRSSLPPSAWNWKPQAQGAIPVCTGRPGQSHVGSCSCLACLALSTIDGLQVQLVPGKLFALHIDVTKTDGNVLRISVSNIYSADSEKVGGGRAASNQACSAAHNIGPREFMSASLSEMPSCPGCCAGGEVQSLRNLAQSAPVFCTRLWALTATFGNLTAACKQTCLPTATQFSDLPKHLHMLQGSAVSCWLPCRELAAHCTACSARSLASRSLTKVWTLAGRCWHWI